MHASPSFIVLVVWWSIVASSECLFLLPGTLPLVLVPGALPLALVPKALIGLKGGLIGLKGGLIAVVAILKVLKKVLAAQDDEQEFVYVKAYDPPAQQYGPPPQHYGYGPPAQQYGPPPQHSPYSSPSSYARYRRSVTKASVEERPPVNPRFERIPTSPGFEETAHTNPEYEHAAETNSGFKHILQTSSEFEQAPRMISGFKQIRKNIPRLDKVPKESPEIKHISDSPPNSPTAGEDETLVQVEKLVVETVSHLDTLGCITKLLCFLQHRQTSLTLEESLLLHIFTRSPNTSSSQHSEGEKVNCKFVSPKCPLEEDELLDMLKAVQGCDL